MSILLTYLSETLTPNLPSLELKGYRGPFTDAHSGAVFVTHVAEPDWMVYCTPGWEGNEGIEVAVVYDGDCLVPIDLAVEWTGDVKKDGKLWREAVTEYLSHLTPEAGAPGWRQVELTYGGVEDVVAGNSVYVNSTDTPTAMIKARIDHPAREPIQLTATASTEQGAVEALAQKLEGVAVGAALFGYLFAEANALSISEAIRDAIRDHY